MFNHFTMLGSQIKVIDLLICIDLEYLLLDEDALTDELLTNEQINFHLHIIAN